MGSYTALNWITVDEQNVDHFTVERSENGNNFYSIVQLPARNSGSKEIYSTSDNLPVNHIAYYRLRSVDIDGKEKLSKVIMITAIDKNNRLDLAGNPVRNRIALLASRDLTGTFTYSISNMSGQLLQHDLLTIQYAGLYEFSLKENIMPGIYSLAISNRQHSFHYLVVVK